jgi:hypothetical protein
LKNIKNIFFKEYISRVNFKKIINFNFQGESSVFLCNYNNENIFKALNSQPDNLNDEELRDAPQILKASLKKKKAKVEMIHLQLVEDSNNVEICLHANEERILQAQGEIEKISNQKFEEGLIAKYERRPEKLESIESKLHKLSERNKSIKKILNKDVEPLNKKTYNKTERISQNFINTENELN